MKKRGKRTAKQSAQQSDRDPLDATPVVPEGVEVRYDSQKRVQLRREGPERGRIRKFLAEKFSMKKTVRVNLDERGTFFWKEINGRRTLHDIERKMRYAFSLEEPQSRKAVIEFTKTLMLRGLVALKLDHNATASNEAKNA